jgi:hypothetical protein
VRGGPSAELNSESSTVPTRAYNLFTRRSAATAFATRSGANMPTVLAFLVISQC